MSKTEIERHGECWKPTKRAHVTEIDNLVGLKWFHEMIELYFASLFCQSIFNPEGSILRPIMDAYVNNKKPHTGTRDPILTLAVPSSPSKSALAATDVLWQRSSVKFEK